MLTPFARSLLRYFRKVLPPLSKTESDALEAGHVWWEGELFCGSPDWNKLIHIPKAKLNAEEHDFLANQVETLCAMLDDWAMVTEEHDLSPEVWDYLKQQRFFGLGISKEYGGLGFSSLAQSQIVTKIASRSPSVGITVMVPNALGPVEFLNHYGTDEQKRYYLPRLATALEIPAFALTSPEAGSDASNIPDVGIICEGTYEGKNVLGIRLNWDKRYITLAPLATMLVVVVKLYDPQQLMGDVPSVGITLCLVPTHLPGVEIGSRHSPLGLAFPNGPTRGKDVFIPLDLVIGGSEYCGKGWQMLMEALAGGRGISLPAFSTALAKLCYRMTGAYAGVREQFGLPLGQFEGIEEAMASMGGLTYLCEAARLFVLDGIMQGVKPGLIAAMAKYHITEMARVIVNQAMDIHAGRGIQLGPRNYLGFLYQAIPIGITVEGANILTRNLIIFGQGVVRCHPFIRDEIAAANNPDPEQSLKQFDQLLSRHIIYILKNFLRTFIYGLGGGLFVTTPLQGITAPYSRQLTRMSSALAFTTDVALVVLGNQLKRKERLSARLGDVLSQLYLASTVIKYFHDQGQLEEDAPFVHWTLATCLYKIQIAFDNFFDNFKPRFLGNLLRFIVFPWGRAYKPAKDTLENQIAMAMMAPSAQRDRITAYCYRSNNSQDNTGRMDRVLDQLKQTECIRKKLHEAVEKHRIPGSLTLFQQIAQAEQLDLFTADEIELLKEFAQLRWEAVQVDEFRSNHSP